MEPLWSLKVGIWGIIEGSWGVWEVGLVAIPACLEALMSDTLNAETPKPRYYYTGPNRHLPLLCWGFLVVVFITCRKTLFQILRACFRLSRRARESRGRDRNHWGRMTRRTLCFFWLCCGVFLLMGSFLVLFEPLSSWVLLYVWVLFSRRYLLFPWG